MPTYVYKFIDTGETIEVQQSFTAETLTEHAHPETGEQMPVKKVFLPVGVTFKGDGFYKTDSRASAKKSSKRESGDGASKSDSRSNGDSASKTDSAPKGDSSSSKQSDSPSKQSDSPSKQSDSSSKQSASSSTSSSD
ncbi:MAG: FmdB family transcriptional regulator [Ilumatobacteraceae bacterium]